MRSRYLKATLTAGCLSLLLAAGVEAQGVTLEEQSQWGPALAYLNNHIFLGWTGRDGKINIMRSAEGVDWRAKITMEEKSERPPTPTTTISVPSRPTRRASPSPPSRS